MKQTSILQIGVMRDPENPTLDEINQYLPRVIKHSLTVEHYLDKLGVKVDDGQHPHDLVGPGNKLEWEVIRGLSLQKRDTPEKQRRYQEAIELHRKGQYHHHKWNTPNPTATEDDLRYGAIDSMVSLREPRDYQGGVHSWEEIEKIIERNPEYKRSWLTWALNQMRTLEEREEGYHD